MKNKVNLFKVFVYFVMIVFALTIIIPLAWVFMALSRRMQSFTVIHGIYWILLGKL